MSDNLSDELADNIGEFDDQDGSADNLTGDDSTPEYPGAPSPLDIDSVLLADIEPSESGPIPVEVTSEIFNSFKEDFGEDESASLQKHWGDQAAPNQSLTRALVEDHQEIQAAIDEHLSLDNGLSIVGVELVGQIIAERAGYSDIDSMIKEHPEIGSIVDESFDTNTGSLSATGTLRVLHYVALRSGYKFKGK